MTILFTDFDGVLHGNVPLGGRHSDHHATLFCYVDPLADVLARFPEVRIVISSSWRHSYNLTELKAFLRPLGSRVIGTTGRMAFGSRYQEIRSFAYKKGPWIALDDDVEDFDEHDCARLVACDSFQGLGEDGKLAELEDKLRRAVAIHEAIERSLLGGDES